MILMSYAQVTPEEAKAMQPKVVLVDDKNAVSKISHYEKHGELA
ncbi:aspartate 1-decarboxylase [Ruminococcus sp.]